MKKTFLSLLSVFLLALLVLPFALSQVSCGSACLSSAQVAQETQRYQQKISGSKCLFIYNDKIYEPPKGTISAGMHKNDHPCGADVTGNMKQSHLNNPNSYLVPYVCAPLCAQQTCTDSDNDGYQSAGCGGNDCNDNSNAIHPGAAETCNNIDDDCDGQKDENIAQKQLTCGIGACKNTVSQSCTAGQFTPACAPKSPVSEVCGNNIDDNCDGQADEGCQCTPGSSSQCGTDTGECSFGAKICQADGTWGSCAGGTGPVSEACGNNIDDNCDGQTDEGCSSGTGSTTTTIPQNQQPIEEKPVICIPECKENCGQDNGCRGSCPDTELYSPGKCGNPSCVKTCSGEACGQADGCGGFCASYDLKTCGLCGNSPCCEPEICADNKDNDCDGRTDENCGAVDQIYRLLAVPSKDTGNLTAEQFARPSPTESINESILKISNAAFLVRLLGILAFFFAGLTLIVGIFRHELIKKFSRKEVIKYHSVLGFFSVFFMALHIFFVFMDKNGWATSISLRQVFLPDFSGIVATNVSLGLFGMYFFLITILSGIFFMKISKKFGYKTWILMHRGSFIFYLFIFFHALRIGTDFRNPYIIIFFMQVFLIIILYILYRVSQVKKIEEKLKSIIRTIGLANPVVSVTEILSDEQFIGKKITTHGNVVQVPVQPGSSERWYQIYDEYKSLFAMMPPGTEPEKYSMITGILKKSENQIYLDVEKLKV